MKYSLLILILFSFCSVNQEQKNQPEYNSSPKPKVRKPSIKLNEDFEADKTLPNQDVVYDVELKQSLKQLNIDSLIRKRIDKNDIEIRIWFSGNFKANFLIFNRTNEIWQGFRISPEPDYETRTFFYKNEPTEPYSDWEITWKKLLDEEILTLPDAKSIGCNEDDIDASSFTFEIKKGKKYRRYSYTNPDSADKEKCLKNIKIINILKILREEFF